jgi:hypothetical protein
LPERAEVWNSNADPYMDSMSVNNYGSKNGGLEGDVIVGYFNVLDEEFDGSSEDEIYFMITNGLTDPFGTSAQTQQTVTIDFDFGSSGITQLQRLDRTTGDVVDVPLTHLTGSRYRLDWVLLGGEGDLFKYDTGAIFVSELPGDANRDGIVDLQDFTILKAHFGEAGSWGDGNFNGDWVIDSQDFTILKAHFGDTASMEAVSMWASSMGLVPEPATLALLAIGGLLALARPRRR